MSIDRTEYEMRQERLREALVARDLAGAEEDAHTADESVALDELRAAVEVYKEMTLAIAGGAKP